jgi:protein TonB
MAKRPRDPNQFIKPPGYDGGKKALDEFIRTHLVYPQSALENRIEGIVKVEYDLDHKGKVVKATTKSNLGHGCEEEAIRLVKLLRYSTLKHRGVKVSFHKSINIVFRLPKQVQQGQITYSYTTKPKSETKKEVKQKKGGAGYIITIKPGPPN